MVWGDSAVEPNFAITVNYSSKKESLKTYGRWRETH